MLNFPYYRASCSSFTESSIQIAGPLTHLLFGSEGGNIIPPHFHIAAPTASTSQHPLPSYKSELVPLLPVLRYQRTALLHVYLTGFKDVPLGTRISA